MGAAKAIVSTEYLHAKEALGEGRGILTGFRNANQLAVAVNSILASDERKRTLEHMAYAYAREMTWPKLGRRWVELMSRSAAADTTRPRPGEARTGAERHAGSPV
jgi:glycosyltransferase involved in cell wall biosynthesis